MKKERCCVCRRAKMFPTEGRIIDGTWHTDVFVDPKYFGKWVCSWSCYCKLLPSKNYSPKRLQG